MSNELSLLAQLLYADSEGESFAFTLPEGLQKTLATRKYVRNRLTVTTSELAIPLGNLATLGYAFFINRDTTNFVEIRVATGGTKFARLDASSGFYFGKFGSGVTAPFAIADTASCLVDYVIFAL